MLFHPIARTPKMELPSYLWANIKMVYGVFLGNYALDRRSKVNPGLPNIETPYLFS